MEKPIALLFTDLHIKETNIEICNSFLKELIKTVSNTPSIKKIIFLGDFFDNRKGLSEIVLNYSIYFLGKLVNLNLPIHFIVGNHDKLINTKEESYLDFLMLIYPSIQIHRKFDYVENKDYPINFAFLSYFEGDIFQNLLKDIEEKDIKENTILFSHYMIEQIPLLVRKKFKYIYLGHNHERGQFPNGQYLGSCFQQNFSEDNKKGFSLLFKDGSVKAKNFCDKEYILQRIDLNSFSLNKIKTFISDFKSKYPTKFLKVELLGTHKDLTFIKDFLKQENIPFSLKLNEEINTLNLDQNISNFSYNKIKDYFKSFCSENAISELIENKIKTILNTI